MADRRVTHSGKDDDGDILSLCNPGEGWSPRSKRDAINDIELGLHRYYVRQSGTVGAWVRVVTARNGKYLRTTADGLDQNNLDNLPDC